MRNLVNETMTLDDIKRRIRKMKKQENCRLVASIVIMSIVVAATVAFVTIMLSKKRNECWCDCDLEDFDDDLEDDFEADFEAE